MPILLPRRRLLKLGAASLLATPAIILPKRSPAAFFQGAIHGTNIGVPINPVTGTYFPYEGNTGYQNAPGYTGSLTTWPGALNGSGLVANTTYTGYLIDLGTSNTPFNVNVPGVTFVGCYFGLSGGGSHSPLTLGASALNTECDYCTFAPSPSAFGGSFPPMPPNGGGYATWPSLYTGGTTSNTGIVPSLGYGYGPGGDGAQAFNGGFVARHCDIWGCSQGLVFSKLTATNYALYDSNWYHDNPQDNNGIAHQDGVGDVQSQTGDFLSHLTITNNTIAGFLNTNALALQMEADAVLSSIAITGNWFAGGSYILWPTGVLNSVPTNITTYTITDNILGANPPNINGTLQQSASAIFSQSGSGNEWRRNTYAGGTYAGVSGTTPGSFIWPSDNGGGKSAHSTDWTGPF